MFESFRDWIQAHPELMSWLVGVSALTFLLSLLVVPWLLTRVPADYFVRHRRKSFSRLQRFRALRIGLIFLKNGAGIVLALAGLLMLVLPGQGVLTLIAALFLLDFPGKYRMEAALIGHPRIFRIVNAIRSRAGKEPLSRPSPGMPGESETR